MKAVHKMGTVIFLMCYNLVNTLSKDEKTSGSHSFFTWTIDLGIEHQCQTSEKYLSSNKL